MSLIFSDTILGITLIPFVATPHSPVKNTENQAIDNSNNSYNDNNNNNNNNSNNNNNNNNNNNSNNNKNNERGTAIAAERLNQSIRAPAIVSIIQNKFIQG